MDKVYYCFGFVLFWFSALLTAVIVWMWFRDTIVGDFLITVLWGHRNIKVERTARFLVDVYCKPSGTLRNKVNRTLIKHYLKKYGHTDLYNEMCKYDKPKEVENG